MICLPRIIPVLLISGSGLIKTTRFKTRVYVGDPINAVKIFNEKEADEIVILDIDATTSRRGPGLAVIERIATEAFMPMGYGGGVQTVREIELILKLGVEKVIINTAAASTPGLLEEASNSFGGQSVVASVDVKKNLLGQYRVYTNSGKRRLHVSLKDYIVYLEDSGVGEIVLNSIDKDGMMMGYDLNLISIVSRMVKIPIVALGGAASPKDFCAAVKCGASAVAAGSMFVFHGRHKAVLINYHKSEDVFRECDF